MEIDSVVFYTNDIDAVVAFYGGLFGIQVEYRQGDRYVSFIFDNGVRLGIKKASQEREKPGAQSVFIAVPDVRSIYERCQQLDLPFHKALEHMDGFGWNFAVYDPDRNKVEFVERELVAA